MAAGGLFDMTRCALTTFSVAHDLARYFAIIPAAFVSTWPALAALNFMRLHSPPTAILSAVIFNALIIVGLIPLALKACAIALNRHSAFYRVTC
jgi:potassium-transporting ATPase ATP-binding subunit